MDLRTAALAIPVEMRPVTIKLSSLVNAACGEEREFPINPVEVYSLNALVNHLELTEDEKENAINAAKQELKTSSAGWLILKSALTKLFKQTRSIGK